MQVKIKPTFDDAVKIDVGSNDSVKELKRKIRAEGIKGDAKLVFEGIMLEDCLTLVIFFRDKTKKSCETSHLRSQASS